MQFSCNVRGHDSVIKSVTSAIFSWKYIDTKIWSLIRAINIRSVYLIFFFVLFVLWRRKLVENSKSFLLPYLPKSVKRKFFRQSCLKTAGKSWKKRQSCFYNTIDIIQKECSVRFTRVQIENGLFFHSSHCSLGLYILPWNEFEVTRQI